LLLLSKHLNQDSNGPAANGPAGLCSFFAIKGFVNRRNLWYNYYILYERYFGMGKFIPYEKLSSKKKRAFNAKRRGTWGQFNPVTRKPANPKAYDRTEGAATES
jgi:hypothetical protein